MLNEQPKIKNPKELGTTIDIILDFYKYSKDILYKYVICLDVLDNKGTPDELLCRCKEGARNNAILLVDQDPLFPPLPITQPDPYDDLQELKQWCVRANQTKPADYIVIDKSKLGKQNSKLVQLLNALSMSAERKVDNTKHQFGRDPINVLRRCKAISGENQKYFHEDKESIICDKTVILK